MLGMTTRAAIDTIDPDYQGVGSRLHTYSDGGDHLTLFRFIQKNN